MSISEEKECKDNVAYANRLTGRQSWDKDIFSYLYKSLPTLKLNEYNHDSRLFMMIHLLSDTNLNVKCDKF